MWNVIAVIATMLPIFIFIHLFFAMYVAKQAKQRGYSIWNWVIVGFLSNSIVFAMMLALMPDKSLEARRKEKKDLLKVKLQHRKAHVETVKFTNAMRNTSIGDMATMDPEKIGLEQSIGDQATRMPGFERSIGDAATRVSPLDRSIGRSIGDQETNL